MQPLFPTIARMSAKFQRGIQRHGVFGVVGVALERARYLAARLRPSTRAQILQSNQRARDFDERFGVDTRGNIHPTELAIDHPNQVHAAPYGASDPEDVRSAIASLSINCRDFAFVDFGSGKGRVLLIASEFPFKRITGVELSEKLHGIAQENINRFSGYKSGCTNVESICVDALQYPLPFDNLVCYFCNPFDATVMREVVSNIRRSFLQRPREILILYYNAKHPELFDREDCFERIRTNGWVVMWRTSK